MIVNEISEITNSVGIMYRMRLRIYLAIWIPYLMLEA
jgi:hypothetical protein